MTSVVRGIADFVGYAWNFLCNTPVPGLEFSFGHLYGAVFAIGLSIIIIRKFRRVNSE